MLSTTLAYGNTLRTHRYHMGVPSDLLCRQAHLLSHMGTFLRAHVVDPNTKDSTNTKIHENHVSLRTATQLMLI